MLLARLWRAFFRAASLGKVTFRRLTPFCDLFLDFLPPPLSAFGVADAADSVEDVSESCAITPG